VHSYHQCQRVKQTPDGWRCYDFEVSDFRETWRQWPNGRIHRCHAGVVEAVVPLIWDDELVGVIFAGQMRAAAGCCDVVARMSASRELWA
jgi:ligand-binding sensor protein